MNRRSFLGSIIALAAAPAIVRADSLMPVRALPEAWGVGRVSGLALLQAEANSLTLNKLALIRAEILRHAMPIRVLDGEPCYIAPAPTIVFRRPAPFYGR